MVGGNPPTMYSSSMRGTTAPTNPLQYPAPSSVLRQGTMQAQTASASCIDPYARPMAVKDLADTMPAPRSVVVKATIVHGNHGYGRQAPPPPSSKSSALQTNSFMRPRSASHGPLDAVMGRKEGTVPVPVPMPRQVHYQNDALRPPGGQVGHGTGVRGGGGGGGPSQLRYSSRSLSTQWLNGLAQTGAGQSGSSSNYIGFNGMAPHSPAGQVLAANHSSLGQVIQVRYGTSNGYLPSSGGGTPVGAPSGRDSNLRTASRSFSTGVEHGFAVPDQIPGVGSRCEFHEQSNTTSLRNQRSNGVGRFDDATAILRNQPDRTIPQGIPTKGTSSLSAMVTQPGATASLYTFADSTSGSNGNLTPVRRQIKVDMSMVSALVDKMRNVSTDPVSCEDDALSGNNSNVITRNYFEPRSQSKKYNPSLVDVSKEIQNTLENPGIRTKAPTAIVANKAEPGIASKPPSGAAERLVSGLGPRNQLISQEKLRRMPVTNTLTGSPFPTKPLTTQDLGHIVANPPRPLPPAPLRQNASGALVERAARPSSQKPRTVVVADNGSQSSSCVDTAEEENSLLGNNDTEFDSVDDEDGSDDLNSYLSDEESSHGTSYSSPSPTIQSRARSCAAKIPAKSSVVARRNHDNDLPGRKISTGSKSAGTRPSPATTSILLSEPCSSGRVGSPCSSSSLGEPQPSLTDSLFSNIPPTINFVLHGQKVEPLPGEFRRLLKWRISPITPNIVKQCIARSGFKPTFKSHTWLGYWGKHMKPPGFKTIRDYQKMNHFPGTFQLGRKDRLWRNLSRILSRFGKKEFDFFPQTYILPADLSSLKAIFEDSGKTKWIIKPPASARGIGIQVVHKWSEIPKNRPVIVQRYLAHPYLINDSKFDLRIYVYVTSFDPLRIYVYEDGLARFASVKYSYSLKNLHNRFMHLTNYSINKRNADYESNSDEDVCQGHKWSLKALWLYMQSKGVAIQPIWVKIKDLVIKTIISTESIINSMVKANVRKRYSCHELFGFDVLLDDKLKPWLIEVNISPSLHSNSQLDINVKGGMIRDLFNLAGFMIPEKNDVLANPGPAPDLSTYEPSNDVCLDRRLWANQKSADEKAKHLYYTQRHSDEQVQATILDILTPDDIRMLRETVDENSRRGDFQRVFPGPTSQPYHAFFEQPRYYNLLLQAWCNRYPMTETRGISMLESYCRKEIHLQSPTSNPKHQWVAPTLNSFTKDIRIAGSTPTASQARLSESPYAR